MCNMQKPLPEQGSASWEVSNRDEVSNKGRPQLRLRERCAKRQSKMKLKTRTAASGSTTAVRCEFYFSSFLSGKQACWIDYRIMGCPSHTKVAAQVYLEVYFAEFVFSGPSWMVASSINITGMSSTIG